MSFPWRTAHRRLALIALAGAALAAPSAVPVSSRADQSLGALNQQLGAEQSKQSHLQSSISSLSGLISSLTGQITFVQTREAALSADLERDRAQLAATGAELARERLQLAQLRARLARARTALANQLVSHYESGSPDLVDVILQANGFRDLLEKLQFLGDAEHQQQRVITVTRVAKAQADSAATRLARLEAADQQLASATAVRVRALSGMNSLLQSRRSALAQAQSLQRAQLAASQSRAGTLRSQISQLEAQQAAAQATTYSGGGLGASAGWVIPYQVVLCESGGQNLPPNSAGASGYYQIMPATWKLFGGSGPAAYLTSKAEQDAVAARIWNGGAGASNWVCAQMLGIP